ncbi:hypothetical protein HY626_03970 [Candidatus Uhrbacteria bacterium]|nr:hypothetical protein [Candidatus Uhrbacteria bacterium]
MIRFLFHVLFFIILLIFQVSFIFALPYPLDRTPLVLVVTVYLYQYTNNMTVWWWLLGYGIVLDILAISVAPFEIFSYALACVTMILLVSHVFTNRSFYGITATALLTLMVLMISELLLIGVTHLFSSEVFVWKNVVFSQLWGMFFASMALLFVFPLFRKMRMVVSKTLLERF